MPRPYQFTISLSDNKGRRGSVSGHIPDTWTLAQVQAYVDQFIIYLDAITTAQIDGCNITLPVTLPGSIKSLPAVESDIEEKLTFSYENSNKKPVTRFSIPAIFDPGTVAIITQKKRIANFLDPDITNFHNLIVMAPALGHPGYLTDQRGQLQASRIRSTAATFIESRGRRRFR